MIQVTSINPPCCAVKQQQRSLIRVPFSLLSIVVWIILIIAIIRPSQGFLVSVSPAITTWSQKVSLREYHQQEVTQSDWTSHGVSPLMIRHTHPETSSSTTRLFVQASSLGDDEQGDNNSTTRLFVQALEDDDDEGDANNSPKKKIISFLRGLRDSAQKSLQSLELLLPLPTTVVEALFKRKPFVVRPRNNGERRGNNAAAVQQETKKTFLAETGSKTIMAHQQQTKFPTGPRWAIAAEQTDLSGLWKPILTTQFKKEYDEYLLNCSQPFVLRQFIVNGMALQKERITQKHNGRDLEIYATNPAGSWNRTLVASGTDENDSYEPLNVTLRDPDGDMVQVEACWEKEGTVHRSWLRGKPKISGGVFETLRYLDHEDPDILICESIFHPSPTAPASKKFRYGQVVWSFQRTSERMNT